MQREVPDVIRVGLAVPLTGQAAQVGKDMVDAAQLAVFDFKPENFDLRIYDTGGDPNMASSIAVKAQQEDVQMMLGPLFAEAVSAASATMGPDRIPIYAFSSDLQVAGEGVYIAGYFPEAQVARTAQFAAQRGMYKFASLVPNDSYGNRMNAAFSDAVTDVGGQLVDTQYYPPDTPGMTQAVRTLARYDSREAALKREVARLRGRSDDASKRELSRLQNRDTLGDPGYEAVMIPEGGLKALQLAPLLAYYDVDTDKVKLLGTWIWDDPALGTEPAMVGAWFAAPPRDSRMRFIQRFKDTYGREPNRLATLAYDGVALAAVLAQSAAPGEYPYSAERLENPEGFSGVDGIFRLHANGEVERGLSIMEVRRGGAQEIDPAPTRFSAPVLTN